MFGGKKNILDSLRMVWAIAGKDIVDGLRNRTVWRYMFIVALIMVGYQYLPMLGQAGEVEIVVYDQGESRLVEALQSSDRHEVRVVTTMHEFDSYMDDGDEGELGIVIPPGYDQALRTSDPITLEGYVLWSSRSRVDKLIPEYEATFSEMMGQEVQIQVQGEVLPGPDSMGDTRMAALAPLLTVLIVGMMTVPTLMFEEKKTQALSTLLVSPAEIGHVIAGKAIAGAVYCLSTGMVVLAFNWVSIVNWGLAIAALIGSMLLGVGLGLALGTYLETEKKLSVWSPILFQPIIIPAVMFAIEPIFPQVVRDVLPWIPNVALAKLFHNSQTSLAAQDVHWGGLIVLAATIALQFVATSWKVRRLDQ
jgi:ABC-type Na+ efflux pump permease subunit